MAQIIDFVNEQNNTVAFTLVNGEETPIVFNDDISSREVVYIHTSIKTIRNLWVLLHACDYLMRNGCRFEIEIDELMGANNPYKPEKSGYTFEIIVALLASCDADRYFFHSIDNEIAKRILEDVLYAEFEDETEE